MHRRFRFSLATLFLVVTCFALALGWWSGTRALRSKVAAVEAEKQELLAKIGSQALPTDALIREGPITLAASEEVGLAGYSWFLSVNSAGNAELANEWQDKKQTFQITAKQLSELRETLIRERFFDLFYQQGEFVPDGGSQRLTISIGDRTKSIQILYLMNHLRGDQAKLREPARALRVWGVVRGWFENPDAADLNKYIQTVSDAAEAVEKADGASQ
jgi:hypothetical protein